MKHTVPFLRAVLQQWGISLDRTCPEISMAGSPERCDSRIVICDTKGELYILENLFPESLEHKLRIAKTLEYLSQQHLEAVYPYLQDEEQNYVTQYQDSYWQVVPFVEGIDLKRPDYVFEEWRGRSLAEFLIQLRQKSQNIPNFQASDAFSILDFNQDFLNRVQKHDPDLYPKVESTFLYIESQLQPAHDNLPVAFCHGDYHPLNVIWSNDGIRAVIDWEFLGYKPEIYDVSNLIGCIGMEWPQSLTGDLIYTLIKTLKEADIIAEHSWDVLFEFVVALRYAWLSEWLHKSDFEMVELETVYIQLLMDNRDIFKRSWSI